MRGVVAVLALLGAGPALAAECKPQIWPPVARVVAPVEAGDVTALAKIAYFEARGDGFCSQAAVVWTAVNRLTSAPEDFGRSLRAVARKRNQYAPLRMVPADDPAWVQAVLVATLVLTGTVGDPTGGAQYFFLTKMRPWPKWSNDLTVTAVIGSHTFLRQALD